MVSASACVGLTLPGMIEEPGSFSGIRISPRPERGPEASQRTSLAIFIRAAASVLIAPCAFNERVVRSERLELVGRGDEGESGQLRDLGGDFLAETGGRVQAGADGRAADRELVEVRQRRVEVRRAP